jgi:predicted lipoprotein with Yx(FWY)xxD motif
MFRSRTLLLFVFALLLLSVIPVMAQDGPTVGLSQSDTLGPYLVGPDGMTLYSFTPDPLNQTVCYNACAENWPPLIVDSADNLTLGEGIPGTLSTIEREDGTLNVAYNGIALYYWKNDKVVGDTTGHLVGKVWWIVPPATAYPQRVADLGTVLVGPAGMTLYMFTKDSADTSNCYEQCATNWPPLLVDSANAVIPGVNLLGAFGTTERTDGGIQVTYNGMPLYYWKDDKAIGDTTGQGVGEVWYVVQPELVGWREVGDMGNILVANNGLTVYTFDKDEAGVSNCTGDCLKNWPAVKVNEGDALVAGVDVSGELGTITRADDNSTQLTLNGMPLYYWKDDKVPGDASGDGVGDVWHVVKPA